MSCWHANSTAFMQNIKRCTLQIRVSPPPLTFAERRSVLQVLEQQGRIKVFKKQRKPQVAGYTNPSFLVVTAEPELADSLASQKTIVYTMTPPRASGESRHLFMNSAHLKPTIEIVHNPDDGQDSTPAGGEVEDGEANVNQDEKKQFCLQIHTHHEYSHPRGISQSPWHNEWPDAYNHNPSFETMLLKQALPPSTARIGLSHWLIEEATLRSPSPAQRNRLRNQSTPNKMMKSKSREGVQAASDGEIPADTADCGTG
ncbi:hypothetical protein B0I35DRAFT_405442 [Stachybotrys elegans]|uniref:Pal1-like protein n=1 Tax=Stachybotrys elegans TaxID=80388 RepID=A0A8K0T4V7_9HYPO|nr:hypothetical protein B0I35DRAFT_405442 [Stachybotrys elegans]